MNQPPNTPPGYGPPNTPPGYGPAPSQQQHGQHPSAPMPHSGSAHPHPPHSGGYHQPQNFRGMTRQMFNPASYRQNASGSWAASSLILSIVSLFFCGLLAPLPMVLGMVGMVGKKRAKGMAFAGFLLSALQVMGWVLLMSLGFWVVFQSEGLANEAGAPVVAAIREFKEDHDRVPHSLDELVALGYLPHRWSEGTGHLSSAVRDTVEGKRWSDFLRYQPGRDASWSGYDGWSETVEGGRSAIDDFFSELSGETPERSYKTYGLAFIGVETAFSTSSFTAVDQSLTFDLTLLWGGDQTTREIAKKRRELQVMARRLDENLERYQSAVETAKTNLTNTEQELRQLIRDRRLTEETIRDDARASGLLTLIGREQRVVALAERRLKNTRDTLDTIDIQMRLLASEEAMSRLADSPQEFAELTVLLELSESVLKDGGDMGGLDRLDEQDFASEWLTNQFGR